MYCTILFDKIIWVANGNSNHQLVTTLYRPESQGENAVAIGVNDVDVGGVGGIQSRVNVMT